MLSARTNAVPGPAPPPRAGRRGLCVRLRINGVSVLETRGPGGEVRRFGEAPSRRRGHRHPGHGRPSLVTLPKQNTVSVTKTTSSPHAISEGPRLQGPAWCPRAQRPDAHISPGAWAPRGPVETPCVGSACTSGPCQRGGRTQDEEGLLRETAEIILGLDEMSRFLGQLRPFLRK